MRAWTWTLRGLAVTVLACSAACADSGAQTDLASASNPGRSCFRSADVTSWAAGDRTTVTLQVGIREFYQIKLLAPCGDIDFSQRIGLRSRGTDFICTGLDVEVIAPTPTGLERCQASSLRRLTTDEVSALPGRARP